MHFCPATGAEPPLTQLRQSRLIKRATARRPQVRQKRRNAAIAARGRFHGRRWQASRAANAARDRGRQIRRHVGAGLRRDGSLKIQGPAEAADGETA